MPILQRLAACCYVVLDKLWSLILSVEVQTTIYNIFKIPIQRNAVVI